MNLKTVISQHPGCMQSRKNMKSVLLDCYPEDRRTVNLILNIFECGIAKEISVKKKIDNITMNRMIQRLVDEYGLQEIYARMAIKLCAEAFDAIILETGSPSSQIPKQEKAKVVTNNRPQASEKVAPVIAENTSDYELKSLGNGNYQIAKFVGFDEEKMIIPNMIDGKNIVEIGPFAFEKLFTVKEIEVSEGIQSIKNGAFNECRNLKSVKLPDSLVCLGDQTNDFSNGVFRSCSGLAKIKIPSKIREITDGTFYFCGNLEDIILNDGIEIIGRYAFASCVKLKHINFPSSLQEIQDYAFNECKELKHIILNEGLKKIGEEAFGQPFMSLKNSNRMALLPRTVEKYGKNIFGLPYQMAIVYCYKGTKGLEYARAQGYKIADASKFVVEH